MSRYKFFGEEFPAIDWFDITPADSTDLVKIPRSIWVGTGGDIVAVSESGNQSTFKGVPSGTLLPIQPEQVAATGTTATDIVGLI